MEKVMMKQGTRSISIGSIAWLVIVVGVMLAVNVSSMPRDQAQNDDAVSILKAMSNYIASQQNLSVTIDTDIEIITPEVQKIQFTSSGQVQLSRPDKLRAHRVGGYTDIEIVYDGKTLTVNSKASNTF